MRADSRSRLGSLIGSTLECRPRDGYEDVIEGRTLHLDRYDLDAAPLEGLNRRGDGRVPGA